MVYEIALTFYECPKLEIRRVGNSWNAAGLYEPGYAMHFLAKDFAQCHLRVTFLWVPCFANCKKIESYCKVNLIEWIDSKY